MKIDAHTLSDILVAHRRAMAVYRKEYMPLGRNAIEVLLYANNKPYVTATEIAKKLLYCNFNQSKRTLGILVRNGLLWSIGKGVKGQPHQFIITDRGKYETEYLMRLYLASLSYKS